MIALVLGLVSILTGCAGYAPAPVDPTAAAERLSAKAIDPRAVRAELRRIAPTYVWDGGEWNRLTLFAAAVTTSPVLESARAALKAAEADVSAARVPPGPTLSLAAEYAFPPEASPWLAGVASDMLLDAGGRRRGRIGAAEIAARAAAFDYAAAVWSVRMAVRRAFDARVSNLSQAALAARLLDVRKRQFAAVQNRVAAGAGSRLDLDLVRSELAAAATLESDARASVTAAELDLAAALGAPQGAVKFERMNASPPDLREIAPLTDADRTRALAIRTEVLKAAADYDQAESALRTAVSSQYPEIHVGPGYSWDHGVSKIPLNVSFVFPSADLNQAAIRAAEARREEAGRRLEEAVASVVAAIDRADADYRAAWSALRVVRSETLPTARAIASQADRELSAGAIDRAGWAASQAGLIAAALDEAAATRRVLDAEAALEDAMRRPLAGPELSIGSAIVEAPKGGES